MSMKLANIYLVGRYRNVQTKKSVNVHKGKRVGYCTNILFYYRSGTRIIISDRDFYEQWKKVVGE